MKLNILLAFVLVSTRIFMSAHAISFNRDEAKTIGEDAYICGYL
jgi:hypothetical protein